jgi:thiosulfate/3-mercaptopyruvate sulfurtransferase
VVSYCNTGHWAATDWFVLHEVLGRSNVRLYDGSMVEWSADARRPVHSTRTKWDDLKKALGLGS